MPIIDNFFCIALQPDQEFPIQSAGANFSAHLTSVALSPIPEEGLPANVLNILEAAQFTVCAVTRDGTEFAIARLQYGTSSESRVVHLLVRGATEDDPQNWAAGIRGFVLRRSKNASSQNFDFLFVNMCGVQHTTLSENQVVALASK